MSKRKARRAIAKDGSVWHLSAEEATLAKKPYYNAYVCKSGAHGDCKYNREKEKRDWKRRMNVEGTFRGPFPYLWGCLCARTAGVSCAASRLERQEAAKASWRFGARSGIMDNKGFPR